MMAKLVLRGLQLTKPLLNLGFRMKIQSLKLGMEDILWIQRAY